MKIKSKLRVVAILPILLVIVVVCTMLFAARGVRNAIQLEAAARAVVTDIYELTELEHEVLGPLHHGEPAVNKRRSKHRERAGKLAAMVDLNPPD